MAYVCIIIILLLCWRKMYDQCTSSIEEHKIHVSCFKSNHNIHSHQQKYPLPSAPLIIISLTMNHEWSWASWLVESTAATASYLLPCCSWPWYFNIWFLIASVALWVLGIRNLSCSVTTAASPAPVPNLNVMMSGFFFLAVILNTVSSLWRCFTLTQPALSDSSRRTSRLSGVRRIWPHN